jgi:3-isopropylmalate/(R)-2-methylmalate dehydratase small subunit
VAGSNFGCGSAMEIAATVILAAGIRAVLAKSFSRTFFRNAINNGLVPIECDTGGIEEGDALSVALTGNVIEVENHTRNTRVAATALPPLMTEILSAGGLVEYTRRGTAR